ncbi:hypothetical protein CALCODRAFT_491658 [Calocera cornea HHB12733]|uniref:Uncharacterized protein n=1 Tax=Calocera cornea HHB12733 TaxID=1353952 RepID=A0A165IUZ6_9BASI|nr:hypothetical protein CALCODRAFT_491658 [Calocera cornea HHB12733]
MTTLPTLTALSKSQSQVWHEGDYTRVGRYRMVKNRRYKCKVAHFNEEDNQVILSVFSYCILLADVSASPRLGRTGRTSGRRFEWSSENRELQSSDVPY